MTRTITADYLRKMSSPEVKYSEKLWNHITNMQMKGMISDEDANRLKDAIDRHIENIVRS